MAQKEHCKSKDSHRVSTNDVLERGEGALVTVAAARAASVSPVEDVLESSSEIDFVRSAFGICLQLRKPNAIECR